MSYENAKKGIGQIFTAEILQLLSECNPNTIEMLGTLAEHYRRSSVVLRPGLTLPWAADLPAVL